MADALPYVIGAGLLCALVTGLVVWVIAERVRGGLRTELESARNAAAVAAARLEQLETRIPQLEARLETSDSEASRLNGETQRLTSERDEAIRRRDEATSAQQSAESARDELRERRARLESELEGLRERAAGLEQRADKAESAASDLEILRRTLADRVSHLSAALSTAENQRDTFKDSLEQQKKSVAELLKSFEERVVATAARTMEERGKAFTENNKKEVETVVAPFREKLDDFRRRVDSIYDAENKERGELKQQILTLTNLNRTVSEKTEQLTHALTVQSKSTGSWGETLLAKILDDSGLRKDREYRLQVPIKGPDGESYIPDAVIDLPEKRQLIVDSKVSNKAWSDYCASGNDEEARASCLKLHLSSLRGHLKSLASKDYSQSPDLNTVDFVLMFVPVEAALLTALQEDDTLYSEAYRSKVILVTPSTLMAVVKLAEGLWTLQRRKESADEIAEAGRKLYDKLTNFAQTFVALGESIDDSRKAFEQAQKQLATGRGNAIRLALSMTELGVSPSAGKQLPAELVELDQADAAASLAPVAIEREVPDEVESVPFRSAEVAAPSPG